MKIHTRSLLDWRKIAVMTGLTFIAVYPFWGRSPYLIHIFNMFFLWSVVASCWNLLMGYAGIWSMANVAFMVIGGYASAILSLRWGLPPWVCIPLAGLSTMVTVTIFIGLPCLRLKGIFVALFSFMFATTLTNITTQTIDISGGSTGLRGIPPLFDGITPIQSFYINFALFLGILTLNYRIIRSSSGLAFMALRDSVELATALGVNEYKEKLKVFALSSFMTGIAGAFYVHYSGAVSPALNATGPFLIALAMMAIGGIGRFPGAVLGAGILVFGGEWLRLFGILRFALIGGLICTIILFFPGGIMQLIDLIEQKMIQFRSRRESER